MEVLVLMDKTQKISLLTEELDDESQKYIQESIQNWKEGVIAQLSEEVESAKQAKIEELEEANLKYREELKEEYSDKLTAAIADLEESVRAEMTAKILRENPELKILESIKDLIAPLISEDYRENAYSDTIFKLSEENEALRRKEEINEGAQTLAELLAPYAPSTQKLVLSLIKEGDAEEVTEQFYQILESLQDVFSEEGLEGDASEEEEPEEDKKDKKKKKKDKEEDDEDSEEDDDDEEDDDESVEESYISEGFSGEDDEDEPENSLRNLIKKYTK